MEKNIRFLAVAALLSASLPAFCQPHLTKDNIDEIVSAMTFEEKASLLVGGARPVMVNGIPAGTAARVPGAAGDTRPIGRLGIPGTVLADGPADLRISPARDGNDLMEPGGDIEIRRIVDAVNDGSLSVEYVDTNCAECLST